MSGAYSLKFLIHGEWDQEEYFNSPLDYVPNLHDDWFLSRMRAAGDHSRRRIATTSAWTPRAQLSDALWDKAVPAFARHLGGAWHDWPIWRDMAVKFLY